MEKGQLAEGVGRGGEGRSAEPDSPLVEIKDLGGELTPNALAERSGGAALGPKAC